MVHWVHLWVDDLDGFQNVAKTLMEWTGMN